MTDSSNVTSIVPVVLAGGSGSRLWPLSRAENPKQFLPLAGKSSLLEQTLARLEPLAKALPVTAPLLLCPEPQRFAVAETLQRCPCGGRVLLEPLARGTAAAVALASTFVVRDGDDPLLLVLPADQHIEPATALAEAIAAALPAAEGGALVLLGITPDYPATGYGYIRAEPSEAGPDYRVSAFIEKPDRAEAQKLLESGGCYWNGGIFFGRASTFLAEFDRHAPQILSAVKLALVEGCEDSDFIRPDSAAFAQAPSDSIDYALVERTDRARVVPLNGDWSDLGSFQSLWQRAEKDECGNALQGAALIEGGRNNLLISEGPQIAALGLNDYTVVASRDAVLVAPRAADAELKALLQRLEQQAPERLVRSVRQQRPWGRFEVLDRGPGFQVKRLVIDPGKGISRQLHRQRAEHWVVVRGSASVLRGEERFVLEANQSTYIPPQMIHQLRNLGPEPLELIEVQTGAYLGEDDIIRLNIPDNENAVIV